MIVNQKRFITIVLIVLVVIAVFALGYGALVKAPAPIEQAQVSNLQSRPTTTPLRTNESVSQKLPQAPSGKVLADLMPITLPSYCDFSQNAEKVWNVNCGRNTKNAAREFMGTILESQGWRLCERGLPYAIWVKNGVQTIVTESLEDSDAASYPFNLGQKSVETDGYGACK